MIDTARTDEAAAAPLHPVLSLQGISKTFGRTKVLDGVDLDGASGRGALSARPQRFGQIDPHQDHRRHPQSRSRRHDDGQRPSLRDAGVGPPDPRSRHPLRPPVAGPDPQPDGGRAFRAGPARRRRGMVLLARPRGGARPRRAGGPRREDRSGPAGRKAPAVDRAIVAIVRAVASLETPPRRLAGSLLVLDDRPPSCPAARWSGCSRRRSASPPRRRRHPDHDTDECCRSPTA